MGKQHWLMIVLVLLAPVLDGRAGESRGPVETSKLNLMDGWKIQSSAVIPEKGDLLSTSRYSPKKWYSTTIPSTIFNALIENKVYPDPYFGMNLRSVKGTDYPIGGNFSNLPMSQDSPFQSSWWYRQEFQVPKSCKNRNLWLHFDGINYRANIWLNGLQIADNKKVAGAFRSYEFDISNSARPGSINVLAVEVFPPQPDDLGLNWVDVNPTPPDKNMGIWRQVYITESGPVTVRYPQVISKLDLPSLTTAHLTVAAELKNPTSHAVRGHLMGRIESISFSREVELEAHEVKRMEFTPVQFPQLNLVHPRIWWPWQFGPQDLYQLSLEFETNGEVSDRQEVQFGIREVTSELSPQGYRLYKVNGRKILARGAGWWPDMRLRSSPKRQEWEIRYFRDMNLNVLRMDGKFEGEYFLNLCDRYGLLLLPGWCCCDHWERWENWKEEDSSIAAESLRDRLRFFRNHPSVLAWLNADDIPPVPKVEQMYVDILRELRWPNPFHSSATARPSSQEPTGLKMTGPYDYIPPIYWLTNKDLGGAFGFLTETSPGPAIPPVESLRRFIPQDHLWPVDEYWDFHAGGNVFKDIRIFRQALDTRYGQAKTLEDFVWKALLMAYDGERAMFEAYGRNKYVSTGVLQEMLNNAWPSLIWSLYDYYLRPAGAYFGTKKACEPLHIQYSYDDRSIVVVNSLPRQFQNLKASAEILDLELRKRFTRDLVIDIAPDASVRVFDIPEFQDLTTTYFIRLNLSDNSGETISSNFYWLSTKPDVLDWSKSEWYYTPTRSHADLTGLQTLPKVQLKITSSTRRKGEDNLTRVTVMNPTDYLAFFVRLRITNGIGGEEVLPVLWEDNYLTLMPGEKREITATYESTNLKNAIPVVAVDGWNIEKGSFHSRY